jgi:hypothetical protein
MKGVGLASIQMRPKIGYGDQYEERQPFVKKAMNLRFKKAVKFFVS